MKNEELLNYAMDNIDQRYIDKTAEALYSKTGKEQRLYEIKVTRSPAPKKKSYKWAVGIAASVAVVAGIGTIAAVLPKTEWGRPSAGNEGIEITLPVTEKPVIETEPVAYVTEAEVFEEPVPEDEICEEGFDYPSIRGDWIGGSGGDYMYAFNDEPGRDLIAINTFTGEIKKGDFPDFGETGTSISVENYRDGVYVYVNATKTITIYDEVLNPVAEAAFPDENSTFMPQWDGKYVWTFKDENESLKRNDKSCVLDLYARDYDNEFSFYKSVTLPQYICGAWYVNYDENKDEIAFFGQKFAKGTDISEGFRSVFCLIDAKTGNVTYELEYDEDYFRKASFDGGVVLNAMRKNAEGENVSLPVILYNDGKECDLGSLVSATGAFSISPDGRYFAIQGGHGIAGGADSKNDKYAINVYSINNRTLSSTPEFRYADVDKETSFLIGNNGLIYNTENGMLNVLIPTDKAETDEGEQAAKETEENEVADDTAETAEEEADDSIAKTSDISLFFPLDQKKWIITTPYSECDPWTGGVGHQAVDYSGETVKGYDVYAETEGTVKIEDKEDYYNVYILGENGSETMITDLYEVYVNSGERVYKGDPIGSVAVNSIYGANVYAAISGTVTECDDNVMPQNDKGKYIVIEDDNGVKTEYRHLSAIYVKTGDKVEKSDLIGAVGSTGFSTGPHLHFEVTVNGNPIDPTLYYEN